MRVTVNKHQAHVFDTADRFETVRGRIEVRHDMGFTCGLETSIQVIDPTVVGANKGTLVPRCGLAHLRAAMAANVVHGANLTVITTNDNDRILTNIYQLIVAFFRYFAAM